MNSAVHPGHGRKRRPEGLQCLSQGLNGYGKPSGGVRAPLYRIKSVRHSWLLMCLCCFGLCATLLTATDVVQLRSSKSRAAIRVIL
ncbi:hypothetical protein BU26DRAFT_117855 [Trematosphaeria pertusa]|uniref:Uncharacterized protein n=1 Tax=Trematosphaeria pertusa TaxID=390896 RepID=A0A6A6HZJ1_9PLEO|nr:uncharacterized protein BU26DRAFT_117855 [Trematosphaeria pertusa]KAF2243446.1 hypothetical protein BU26DRAFT_117855 [Trematosphaeria pertusa]